jgi:hypothetical protein
MEEQLWKVSFDNPPGQFPKARKQHEAGIGASNSFFLG